MNLKLHDKFIIWFAIFFNYNFFQLTVANNEVNSDIYDIGVGIADITGQAADVGMVCSQFNFINFNLHFLIRNLNFHFVFADGLR